MDYKGTIIKTLEENVENLENQISNFKSTMETNQVITMKQIEKNHQEMMTLLKSLIDQQVESSQGFEVTMSLIEEDSPLHSPTLIPSEIIYSSLKQKSNYTGARVFEENQVGDANVEDARMLANNLHIDLLNLNGGTNQVNMELVDLLEWLKFGKKLFDEIGSAVSVQECDQRFQVPQVFDNCFEPSKYGVEFTLETNRSDMSYCTRVEVEFSEWKGGTKLLVKRFVWDMSLLFGKLITQLETFVNQVALRSWKDSFKALNPCEDILTYAEGLNFLVGGMELLATKVWTDLNLFGCPIEHRPMQSYMASALWNVMNIRARPKYFSDWWHVMGSMSIIVCELKECSNMKHLCTIFNVVVGVIGDGTNYAPALHEADLGLAMGIAGTKVAKERIDVICLHESFSAIVIAGKWRRSAYINIQKFVHLHLTINVAALLINFFSVCLTHGRKGNFNGNVKWWNILGTFANPTSLTFTQWVVNILIGFLSMQVATGLKKIPSSIDLVSSVDTEAARLVFQSMELVFDVEKMILEDKDLLKGNGM